MKKIVYILLIFEITHSQKLPNPEDFEVWEPEPQVVVTGSINSHQVMQLLFLMVQILIIGIIQ